MHCISENEVPLNNLNIIRESILNEHGKKSHVKTIPSMERIKHTNIYRHKKPAPHTRIINHKYASSHKQVPNMKE